MKQIQEELGENPVEQEIEEMRRSAKKKNGPRILQNNLIKELR